jgi:hypothetical protein
MQTPTGTEDIAPHSSLRHYIGGEWLASRPGRALPPVPTGWVGLRAGPDTEARGKTLFPCRRSKPGRQVCSQTLH